MLQCCSYLLSFDATPTLHHFLFHSVFENIGPHNEYIQTFSHSYTKRTNRTQSNTTDSFPFLFIQTFPDDYKILTKPIFTCLSIMHTHIYMRARWQFSAKIGFSFYQLNKSQCNQRDANIVLLRFSEILPSFFNTFSWSIPLKLFLLFIFTNFLITIFSTYNVSYIFLRYIFFLYNVRQNFLSLTIKITIRTQKTVSEILCTYHYK